MGKNYKHMLLLGSLTFLLSNVKAQTVYVEIRGRVSNEHKEPSTAAIVRLCRAADTTLVKESTTAANGTFTFGKVPRDNYLVLVDLPGYSNSVNGPYLLKDSQTAVYSQAVFDLGDIVLQEDAKQLNTVVVTKKAPLQEYSADKVILNIGSSTLAAGSSALEILSKAPGVSVDNEGNISLKGKRGVGIMIDGKLTNLSAAQLANLLRSTDGNIVQTIELISNPSAKFDASGSGGLININLKKKNAFGTNGNLTFGGGIGRYAKGSAGIVLNHRGKNMNLFGDYNYAYNKTYEDLNLSRSTTSGMETVYFDQRGQDIAQRNNNAFKAGVDYYINEKTVLGVVVNGYANSNDIYNRVETKIGSNRYKVDSSTTAINPLIGTYTNKTFNLNYKRTIDTLGQELTADADYSIFRSKNRVIYNNFFFNASGQSTDPALIYRNATPSDVRIRAGKLDYTYPIDSAFKIEAGLKTSRVQTDNNFVFENAEGSTWTNDPLKSNRFIYTEQLHAAYTNLHKEFGSTTLELGLRVEQTQSKGNSITKTDVVKRSYIDLFPNIVLKQTLHKDHDLSITYNRRIDRPDYQSLNPFLYNTDLYTYSRGNPLLKPQYTNSVELGYGYKKTLNVTLGASFTKDVITTTLETDTLKKTITLFEQNLASQKTYNLNISEPIAIAAWWSTNNNFTLYYTQYDTPDLMGLPFRSGKLTYLLNSTHELSIRPSLHAEVAVNYQAAQVYGTYAVRPLYGMDIGLSKSLSDNKGSVKLAVSDVFNTRKANISSAIAAQDYHFYQKEESRIFRLTFMYNFGSTAIKGAREKSNGSGSEQRRVRGGN